MNNFQILFRKAIYVILPNLFTFIYIFLTVYKNNISY